MKTKLSHQPQPSELKSDAAIGLTLRQILVPIDFSACSLSALNYALGLAERFGAKVTLLHVVEPEIYQENYPATLAEGHQTLIRAGQERLAELQSRAAAHGLRVASLVRMGRAQSEIGDTAKAIGADLIVIGTHGHSTQQQALLGGTADRVVRQAPCPVLIVRHIDYPA